jgi:rubrerythrin
LNDYTGWQPNSDASATEVLAAALRIDAFMQAFYQRAAQMAPSESIRDLFENLAEAVKAKQQDQASNVSFLEDI